jgi:hypothetical protein
MPRVGAGPGDMRDVPYDPDVSQAPIGRGPGHLRLAARSTRTSRAYRRSAAIASAMTMGPAINPGRPSTSRPPNSARNVRIAGMPSSPTRRGRTT